MPRFCLTVVPTIGLMPKPLESRQSRRSSTLSILLMTKNTGLRLLSAMLGDPAVFFGNRYVGFHHDPDDIGAVGRLHDLFLDGEFEIILGVFDAGGIDQPEVLLFVRRLGGDAITGRAGFARHDGLAPIEDGVEQAGLAHIGPANDGYDR